MQERKKKIRTYVDKLTADKAKLEETVAEKSASVQDLQSACSSLSDQIGILNGKHQLLKDEVGRWVGGWIMKQCISL